MRAATARTTTAGRVESHADGRVNALAREARLAVTAWMFFTRVRLPDAVTRWTGYTPAMLNASARYFPVVGALVGAVGALTFWAAAWLWPPAVAVVLSMIATVLMTGAFHEDGLADCCDGFGGGYAKERVLEIMRDSRVGAFGALGVALALLLKFATLAALAEAAEAEIVACVIVLAHTVSRTAAVGLMRYLVYVRVDEGPKAKPLAEGITAAAWWVALGFLGLPLAFAAWWFEHGWAFALGVVPVAVVASAAGAYFVRRIGGYTGDCLGAAQQVSELAYLLFAAALFSGAAQ